MLHFLSLSIGDGFAAMGVTVERWVRFFEVQFFEIQLLPLCICFDRWNAAMVHGIGRGAG